MLIFIWSPRNVSISSFVVKILLPVCWTLYRFVCSTIFWVIPSSQNILKYIKGLSSFTLSGQVNSVPEKVMSTAAGSFFLHLKTVSASGLSSAPFAYDFSSPVPFTVSSSNASGSWSIETFLSGHSSSEESSDNSESEPGSRIYWTASSVLYRSFERLSIIYSLYLEYNNYFMT